MQQQQNFVIKPNGKVQGGKASYTVDSVTGEILFSAEVTVKVLFIKKTVQQAGKYVVDPSLLKPEALAKLGDKVVLGQVTFTVQEVDATTAKVAVDIAGQNIKGYAIVDRQGEIIRILRLFAEGTVGPFSLTIEALEEKLGTNYRVKKRGLFERINDLWEAIEW